MCEWKSSHRLCSEIADRLKAVCYFIYSFEDEELDREATVSKKEIVRIEGDREVRRTLEFYNLDAIIAVGYRVNLKKATRFRQWATKTLKEYIQKGFVLNDEMLKKNSDYVSVISEDIKQQMKDRMQKNQDLIYWVVVFDEYVVAPGFMGVQEFTINNNVIKDIRK